MWRLREEDESGFDVTLPADDATGGQRSPWLLHSLEVNALNFCAFAAYDLSGGGIGDAGPSRTNDSLLLATPGVQDGHINLTLLPDESRLATISAPKGTQTGLLMAVGLCRSVSAPLVAAGYESGHVALWRRNPSKNHWEPVYLSHPHSQPVLSVFASSLLGCFFSSSADAIVARHPFASSKGAMSNPKPVQTKHAGQQCLTLRSDGKIFATAGWDSRVRVYSAATMLELAVLKWHREGCYAVAFADVTSESTATNDSAQVTKADDITIRATTVSQQRAIKARNTHWLAAGSKDGKVSLWDIF